MPLKDLQDFVTVEKIKLLRLNRLKLTTTPNIFKEVFTNVS